MVDIYMRDIPSVVEKPEGSSSDALWEYRNSIDDVLRVRRNKIELCRRDKTAISIPLADIEEIKLMSGWKTDNNKRVIMFNTITGEQRFVADTTHNGYLDAITLCRQLQRMLVAYKSSERRSGKP